MKHELGVPNPVPPQAEHTVQHDRSHGNIIQPLDFQAANAESQDRSLVTELNPKLANTKPAARLLREPAATVVRYQCQRQL